MPRLIATGLFLVHNRQHSTVQAAKVAARRLFLARKGVASRLPLHAIIEVNEKLTLVATFPDKKAASIRWRQIL